MLLPWEGNTLDLGPEDQILAPRQGQVMDKVRVSTWRRGGMMTMKCPPLIRVDVVVEVVAVLLVEMVRCYRWVWS
jgi:hypothetical protein